MKRGGTGGGEAPLFAGLCTVLTALGLFWLFDSIQVTSGGCGLISRTIGGGGVWDTTSPDIIFAPFVLGVVILECQVEDRMGATLVGYYRDCDRNIESAPIHHQHEDESSYLNPRHDRCRDRFNFTGPA